MSAPVDKHKHNNKLTYFKEFLKDPALPIHISGFLDLLGVSMILPLLLTHCKHLGVSPTVTGILGSFYGAIQLFTSPIIGRWSDVAGRRFTLLVCLFMSACGYTMFSIATTITMMFVARLPLGIFKHSQNIGKSYLADITSSSQHTTVLGHFNAASSIGFILGPPIGGHIAEKPGGFHVVGLIAGVIFFINYVLIWKYVPESHTIKEESLKRSYSSATSLKKMESDEMNFSPNTFWTAVSTVDWSELWDLFLIKFLLGSAVIVFRSNFSLILMQKYDTTPIMNGYIISFQGVIATFTGFFTGDIAKYFDRNAKLLFYLSCVQVITLLSLALSPSLVLFILAIIPFNASTTVARVASVSLTIERGSKKEVGILMGFQQSCMSVSRMIGPLIAGLAQEVSPSGPGLISAMLSMIAVCLLIVLPQDPEERRKRYTRVYHE